jgi:hypothetical protein
MAVPWLALIVRTRRSCHLEMANLLQCTNGHSYGNDRPTPSIQVPVPAVEAGCDAACGVNFRLLYISGSPGRTLRSTWAWGAESGAGVWLAGAAITGADGPAADGQATPVSADLNPPNCQTE